MTLRRPAQQIRDAGANVIDRFMPSSHIGHNKFQVLDKVGHRPFCLAPPIGPRTRCVRKLIILSLPLAQACGGLHGILEQTEGGH